MSDDDFIASLMADKPESKPSRRMAHKAVKRLREALASQDDDAAVEALRLAVTDLTTDFDDGED